MIQEINFKQVEHLIFELATFSKEERIELGSLCSRMAKDSKLEVQYANHIKSLYVHNYKKIKKNNYQKVPFSEINKTVMHAIENGEKAPATIDPSLNKSSPTETLARIQSIRSAVINK